MSSAHAYGGDLDSSKGAVLVPLAVRLEPRHAHVGDYRLVEGLDGEGRLAGRHVLEHVALGHVLRHGLEMHSSVQNLLEASVSTR